MVSTFLLLFFFISTSHCNLKAIFSYKITKNGKNLLSLAKGIIVKTNNMYVLCFVSYSSYSIIVFLTVRSFDRQVRVN